VTNLELNHEGDGLCKFDGSDVFLVK
jgi:hypothetical protein